VEEVLVTAVEPLKVGKDLTAEAGKEIDPEAAKNQV
jgi:hypothetical protein